MSMERLSTNPRRATLAAAGGAVIGALGVVAAVLVFAAMASGVSASDLVVSILIFLVALVGWSLGLFLVGLPLWWLFHRNGWRGRRVAMLLGGFTTFVIVLLLERSGGILAVATGDNSGEDFISFVWVAVMAVLGAIVALVIWRIAYRPAERT
ncbi:MAG TPA: hypothetical protein VJV39_04385 [Dongiaceae bacterium]|nr:hypothetical protein [Dongiaceae bacterium]